MRINSGFGIKGNLSEPAKEVTCINSVQPCTHTFLRYGIDYMQAPPSIPKGGFCNIDGKTAITRRMPEEVGTGSQNHMTYGAWNA